MGILTNSLQPAAAAATSIQLCPTLCDPIDGSPPGSPVPGILQARTLEWVAIPFSNAGKWKVKVKLLSRVRLLASPWTAAYQAPLSMGFSRSSSGPRKHGAAVVEAGPIPTGSLFSLRHGNGLRGGSMIRSGLNCTALPLPWFWRSANPTGWII